MAFTSTIIDKSWNEQTSGTLFCSVESRLKQVHHQWCSSCTKRKKSKSNKVLTLSALRKDDKWKMYEKIQLHLCCCVLHLWTVPIVGEFCVWHYNKSAPVVKKLKCMANRHQTCGSISLIHNSKIATYCWLWNFPFSEFWKPPNNFYKPSYLH